MPRGAGPRHRRALEFHLHKDLKNRVAIIYWGGTDHSSLKAKGHMNDSFDLLTLGV